jgi:hypothetical protein
VSLRVQGTADQVRSRLPAGIATVRELPASEADADAGDWVRVSLRAERLEWVPSVLAWLNLPFVIEHPQALRDHVRDLADRLTRCADAVPGPGAPDDLGHRLRPEHGECP